jgi:hypothetical protein
MEREQAESREINRRRRSRRGEASSPSRKKGWDPSREQEQRSSECIKKDSSKCTAADTKSESAQAQEFFAGDRWFFRPSLARNPCWPMERPQSRQPRVDTES